MSYLTEKARVGREPLTVVELDLDYCSQVEGVSPCLSTATGDGKCYNTRFTCNYTSAYTKSIKTYRFCQARGNLPKGVNMFPVIVGTPDLAPVKAPAYGLSDLGKISITLQDFPHGDIGIDKSISNRTYNAESQGTFFGKLLARNPYYIGRVLRVRTGFITDPFDWANFQDRTYVIDKIEGPDHKGRVKITAHDRLRLADDKLSQCPVMTDGTLSADIAAGATSLSISGDETQYPTGGGTIRIGDDIIAYTSRSGATLSGLTHAQWGSTDESHDAGDTIQLCKIWTDINVVDIVHELLKDYAGIDETKLPYDAGLTTPTGTNDEWDDAKANWLSLHNLTTCISEPTGIKTLLKELAEECQFSLFADQVNDEIRLKVNTPPLANETPTSLNDDANFIEGSVRVKEDPKQQFTQVWCSYDKIDYTKGDDVGNFRVTYADLDSEAESADFYNTKKVKWIKSRWFDSTNATQAKQLVGRLRSRFANPPKVVHFTLDAKDSALWTGDLAELSTRMIQATDGSNQLYRVQVLSVDESIDQYKYEALTSQFTGRYGFIGPNTLSSYSSESAENRQKYAFISPDSGIFADGTEAYKII